MRENLMSYKILDLQFKLNKLVDDDVQEESDLH